MSLADAYFVLMMKTMMKTKMDRAAVFIEANKDMIGREVKANYSFAGEGRHVRTCK